jgi:hypothetical protein
MIEKCCLNCKFFDDDEGGSNGSPDCSFEGESLASNDDFTYGFPYEEWIPEMDMCYKRKEINI